MWPHWHDFMSLNSMIVEGVAIHWPKQMNSCWKSRTLDRLLLSSSAGQQEGFVAESKHSDSLEQETTKRIYPPCTCPVTDSIQVSLPHPPGPRRMITYRSAGLLRSAKEWPQLKDPSRTRTLVLYGNRAGPWSPTRVTQFVGPPGWKAWYSSIITKSVVKNRKSISFSRNR